MIQTNLPDKGKSFRWVGEYKLGEHYFNDKHIQDFVSFEGVALVCRCSHLSDESNKPVVTKDDAGWHIENRTYWNIAVAGDYGNLKFTDELTTEEIDNLTQ